MRVNPISIANYPSLQPQRSHKITQLQKEINFKNKVGAAGSAIGTLIGMALGTFLSGGIGGILIGSMLGCGAGGIIGESKGNVCGGDEFSYELPNKYD